MLWTTCWNALVIVGYVGVSCNVQVVVRWMALGVNINSTKEGTACGSSSEDESNCIGYLLVLLLYKSEFVLLLAGNSTHLHEIFIVHISIKDMYFCFLSDVYLVHTIPFRIFCLIGTWHCCDLCKFWHRHVYQYNSLHVSKRYGQYFFLNYIAPCAHT